MLLIGLDGILALLPSCSGLREVMCTLVMGLLTYRVEMQSLREYLSLLCGCDKVSDKSNFKGEGLFWVMPLDKVVPMILNAVSRKKKLQIVTTRWCLINWILRHLV